MIHLILYSTVTLENILHVISNEIFVKLKILLFHMLFVYAFELFKESHCYLTIWFVILGVYKTSKKVSWRHFIAVESLILGVLSHILNAPASLRRTKSEVVGGSKKMLPRLIVVFRLESIFISYKYIL